MPDLPWQEANVGGELEATIVHERTPAGADEPIDSADESIGEFLRQSRLRMGKTLSDISRASKIVAHHLNAIENNAFEALPGRAYAIGFVRSYAACLGLDAGPLIARLKAELAGPDMDPVFIAPNPPSHTSRTESATVDNGDADDFSAEARPRRGLGW